MKGEEAVAVAETQGIGRGVWVMEAPRVRKRRRDGWFCDKIYVCGEVCAPCVCFFLLLFNEGDNVTENE